MSNLLGRSIHKILSRHGFDGNRLFRMFLFSQLQTPEVKPYAVLLERASRLEKNKQVNVGN